MTPYYALRKSVDSLNYHHNIMAFTDLIVTHDNVISKELCEEIVTKFDGDDRKFQGMTGGITGEDLTTKVSTDLGISTLPEWSDIDSQLFNAVSKHFGDYIERYHEVVGLYPYGFHFHDMGYQIQKTAPGEFYHWHHDYTCSIIPGTDHHDGSRYIARDRVFTYILYLNDRDDDCTDGRTQFTHCGEVTTIIPKAGRLLLFPANPIYTHRGETLETGVKYLMTGWCGYLTSMCYTPTNEEERTVVADYLDQYDK